MKILAINGSPRKNRNTTALLQAALDGAASKGAETEMINLYDLNFKGCKACYGCKLKNKTVNQCIIRDNLHDVLSKVLECDALLLGSPIYFNEVTGEMRSFLERLWFPYISYDNKAPHFPKKLPSVFVYSGNITESLYKEGFYDNVFEGNKKLLDNIIGPSQYTVSCETQMFDNYDRYVSSRFDADYIIKRHQTVFEDDKARMWSIGESLIK